MGSRRAYSASVVVGTDRALSPLKAQVTAAIKLGDSKGIAVKSAKLIAKSENTGDIFYHGLKLLPFLKKFESRAKKLTKVEIDRQLKNEWSAIKRREKIKDDPALNKTVLDAAKAVLLGKK